MGLFGKKTKDHVVDVMLSMAIHPSNILLEGPANIRNWSERTLRDKKSKWKLAPDAKTGFIMAPGRSLDQVKNDLPEQMQKFMRMNGFDPRQYNTESFTVHLDREDIKYVCMTASRKPQGVKASESTQRPTLSDEEPGFFQYPADLIPPLAGYCSDPQCPCSETEIPKGTG